MQARFAHGSEVRVVRNVRNDGTFPGLDIGEILVTRGSVGYVQNIGVFLQQEIIYSVHFLQNQRLVGCRENELIALNALWLPSKFEFKNKVQAIKQLAINNKIVVENGSIGEIVKVIELAAGQYDYHVRFMGKTLQVPESALVLAT